jgi:hypothetical protein
VSLDLVEQVAKQRINLARAAVFEQSESKRRQMLLQVSDLRKAWWQTGLGDASLFHLSVVGAVAVDDLMSRGSFDAWYAVPDEQNAGPLIDPLGTCRGFLNIGETCYANAVCQVLLRTPAVAHFLFQHVLICEEDTCVTCCFWNSRNDFGSAPSIVLRRTDVSESLRDLVQRDVLEFLDPLLCSFRSAELRAGRKIGVLGFQRPDEDAMTKVDALFGIVSQRCLRCVARDPMLSSVVDTQFVLRLDVPREADLPEQVRRPFRYLLSDLYSLSCAPVVEDCCGHLGAGCAVQRRCFGDVAVLFVYVARAMPDDSVSRHEVCLEDPLKLAGFPTLGLRGVIYHAGEVASRGHYACACKMASGDFMYFDDNRKAQCLGSDITNLMRRSVVLLVYSASD